MEATKWLKPSVSAGEAREVRRQARGRAAELERAAETPLYEFCVCSWGETGRVEMAGKLVNGPTGMGSAQARGS